MNISPINAIKQLINIALCYDMPDLKEDKNYLELLNMLKNASIENKSKINLLIMLFEELFIEKGSLKQKGDTRKINDYINYCNIKSIPNELNNESDFLIIKNCFMFAGFDEIDILLIYYLMKIKKEPLLFFRAMEAVLSVKDEYYIKNNKIKIENITYLNFVFKVGQLFKYDDKDIIEGQYTFDFIDNKLVRKQLTIEEINKYLSLDEIKVNKIFKFIKINQKEIAKIPDIKETSKQKIIQTGKINDKKDLETEIRNLKNKIKELEIKNTISEKEISTLKNQILSLEDNKAKSEIEISSLKAKSESEISSLKAESESLKAKLDQKISNLNERHNESILELKKEIEEIKSKNNFLNMKFNSSENARYKLSEELNFVKIDSKNKIDNLNNELKNSNTINRNLKKNLEFVELRDSSKCIIDFLYSMFNKDIDLTKKYEEKVDNICKIIMKNAKDNKKEFIKQLINFLGEIQKNKIKGDNLAHGDKFKYEITNGYENVKKFLYDYIEIHKYFSLFSSLYAGNIKREEISTKIKNINNITKKYDLLYYLKYY